MLVVIPALRLALPTTALPPPLPAQHQDAETFAFALAFIVVLPLAAFAGYRLAARLLYQVGPRALLSVAACLLAGLSLVVLATRGAEAAGLGDSFVWLLALAIAWWLAAAGALVSLLTPNAPHRLLPAPRTAWALAGLLGAGAALACVELGSLPIGVLAGGAVVAVGAFAAANRAELPRPARTWGRATDIVVIGLVVLGVTGVQVISPEDPGLVFERQIIQFHQDFFLGPANQVIARRRDARRHVLPVRRRRRSTRSSVCSSFVPVGNGTLGLFDGLLSALVFAAAYGGPAPRRRLTAGWRVRRWPSRSSSLVYGLLYPVGGAAAARGDPLRGADRRPGRRRCSRRAGPAPDARLLQLAALGGLLDLGAGGLRLHAAHARGRDRRSRSR